MLISVIVGWLIVVDLIVIFLSSKGDSTEDMPDRRQPFSQLASLVQQLCSSETLLGRSVKVASESLTTYLSCSVPGGIKVAGKFNLEVRM